MNMKTTLGKILSFNPCGQEGTTKGWGAATKHLESIDPDMEVTPMDILKYAGIRSAVWCLRAFDYIDQCLFLADIAESVLYIFERECPNNTAPRECIEGIRKYHRGEIDSLCALKERAKKAAYDADSTAARAAGVDAVYAAGAVDVAYAAGYAAASAADAVDYVYDAADHTTDSASYAAAADPACGGHTFARVTKWEEIELLYIKHFK